MNFKFVLPLILIMTVARAQQTDGQDTHSDHLLNQSQRWGFGMLTAFGVSMLGFLAAILVVYLSKSCKPSIFDGLNRCLFALACGTLIGDAMIHILAEAYQSSLVQPVTVNIVFVCSLLGFILLEKVFHKCGITHKHWVNEPGHDHDHHDHDHDHSSHSRSEAPPKKIDTTSRVRPGDFAVTFDLAQSNPGSMPKITDTIQVVAPEPQKKPDSNNVSASGNQVNQDEGSEPKTWLQSMKGKGSAGYMNLIGSLIHNFIDGLSIGIVFATGDKQAIIPLVIAVFAHEIPRELGDVAVLLKSQFTGMQTICFNGGINMISLLGAIIGLATTNISQSAQTYIMVFVAGNFIYIASDIWKHLFNGKWKTNLVELFGFVLGVVAMFLILLIETDHSE